MSGRLAHRLPDFFMNHEIKTSSDNSPCGSLRLVGMHKTDLGTVKNGATFNLEYLISNNADSVIELESAVSSCDCVEVRASDLEPKAKGTVYVDFAPTDKKGAFHIPVTLRYRGLSGRWCCISMAMLSNDPAG